MQLNIGSWFLSIAAIAVVGVVCVVGVAAIGLIITEALCRAIPGMISYIHRKLKLQAYGAPPVMPLRVSKARPEASMLPPKPDVYSKEPDVYSKEFGRQPFTRAALQPPPGLINERVCTNCGKRRRNFAANGMCLRCQPAPAETAGDRAN